MFCFTFFSFWLKMSITIEKRRLKSTLVAEIECSLDESSSNEKFHHSSENNLQFDTRKEVSDIDLIEGCEN